MLSLDFQVGLCLIPASLSLSHPTPTQAKVLLLLLVATVSVELMENKTLPHVLIKPESSRWEVFLSEGKTDDGIVLPNAKKFPTWNLHKMVGRLWSGII